MPSMLKQSVAWFAGIVTCAVLIALPVTASAATTAAAQERFTLEDDQWARQETYAPDTPEGELQAARRLLAEDQGKEAEKAADAWIKRYPNHGLLPDAYLIRADAKVARRHYYRALFDYEYLIRNYPGSEHFQTALEREHEIARLFASGMKRRWLGMRILPAYDEAEEIFIRTQERAPGSELGERASLGLGDFYFDRGEMSMAAEAYDLFLQNYPRSRFRERVLLRLIDSNLARFKGPQYDPTGLIDASERIRQYQSEFPAGAERMGAQALLVRIEESLALNDLHTAEWYDRQNKEISAAYLYRRVVRDHPTTVAARRATDRLAKLDRAVVEPETGR